MRIPRLVFKEDGHKAGSPRELELQSISRAKRATWDSDNEKGFKGVVCDMAVRYHLKY
jgi:hypothetical protein